MAVAFLRAVVPVLLVKCVFWPAAANGLSHFGSEAQNSESCLPFVCSTGPDDDADANDSTVSLLQRRNSLQTDIKLDNRQTESVKHDHVTMHQKSQHRENVEEHGTAGSSLKHGRALFRRHGQNPLEVEGDLWELINSSDVANVLPYMRGSSGAPLCMQGLVWMDQQCLTGPELPDDYQCVTLGGFLSADEFLTSFSMWNGTCLAFSVNAWTFGNMVSAVPICSNEDSVFCQTNAQTHMPCDEGAFFQGEGPWALEKTSFGWDRVTLYRGFPLFHYPLHHVIDGSGQQTEWFEHYLDEVTRTSCPIGRPNCRLTEWASTGQHGRCLHEEE